MPKIHIGTSAKSIVEVTQLAAELQSRGCEVTLIHGQPSIDSALDESIFTQYLDADLLYYRSGLGDIFRSELGSRIGDQNIINRIYLTNPYQSNKLYQALTVARCGIVIPKTVLIGGQTYDSLQSQVGETFVMKGAYGIQGKQVFLVHSTEQYVREMDSLRGEILAQELIPNTGDYRVFVIGGRVHEIFKRVPAVGSFKANIFQGGRGETVSDDLLRERLSKIAIRAATALSLDITGIDIIEHQQTGELYFIEANGNPGWKGLDTALGCNTSAVVADWFLERLR